MLTRREAIAAGAAGLLTGGSAVAESKPLKRLYRLENGKWVQRRMSEFQVGNYMRYINDDEPPVYVKVATRPAFVEAEGVWGCEVIDIQPDDIPKHLLTE